MAQQLSTSTEQQIWHLCQRLEFFANHQPLALQKLAASSTNDNYYVHTHRGHYLLRHYAPFVEGVCRQLVLRCQHAAAAVKSVPGYFVSAVTKSDQHSTGCFAPNNRPALQQDQRAVASRAAVCLLGCCAAL